MKIEIDFNDSEKSGIKKAFLFDVAKKTLAHQDFQYLKNKNISLSFATVLEGEIAKMNAIYRGKKTATDVLSFSKWRIRVTFPMSSVSVRRSSSSPNAW